MTVAFLYAALVTLLYLVLTFRTIVLRGRLRVALGDGNDKALQRAIRAHANLGEYAPLALLLLYMAEVAGARPATVHALGAALLLGRLLHALGISRVREPLPLRMAGMVGARNGWVEVPYVECPADAGMLRGRLQRFHADDLDVAIVPGLACRNPRGAPDVMRGEETQVFGALALQPALARGRRVLVLPGTHCKWVQLEDGRIQRFQTSFSGELFALLRRHSQLAGALDVAHDEVAFGFGLARAQAVASLGHVLFEARSRQLREGMPAAAADDFLSGLVIGSDVQGALDLLAWQADGLGIGLVGEPALCARYAQALAGQGYSTSSLDGASCALAGLHLLAND